VQLVAVVRYMALTILCFHGHEVNVKP